MDCSQSSSSNQRAMFSASNALITGGTYTQYVNQVQRTKTGFELLQDSIAPSAFHNSGERFDPPKCHPNMRTVVIQKIMAWILAQDARTKGALIMWLYGAAGAGKSAIAQTIAEICCAKGFLVGSFFFGRSDPNRNHARFLFPTIAYQLALVFPQLRERLSSVIEHDPMIFTRSLSTQFSSLIVESLKELGQRSIPHLVIIDGLDECLDRDVQCQILDIIFGGVRDHNLPLTFLIASRPEHDIKSRFNTAGMGSLFTRLALDKDYQSFQDIERFFRDKFKAIVETHPFRQFIPTSWPKDDVIQHLVGKSSGQFIYASTIIKYIGLSRRLPHDQLDVIMQTRSAGGDMPFAELDALYRHIFSSLDNTVLTRVLFIISFHFILREDPYDKHVHDIYAVGKILSLDAAAIETLFCDLNSIISLSIWRDLLFMHASLSDFLLDKSRSGPYHIDLAQNRLSLCQKCIQFLTDKPFCDPAFESAHLEAMKFLVANLKESLRSPDLYPEILSFSIPHIFGEMLVVPANTLGKKCKTFGYFISSFLPTFFKGLRDMGELMELLYTHHLRSLDTVLNQHVQAYYSGIHLTLLLVLVDFAITTKRVNISFGWKSIFGDELGILQDTDNRRLFLLDRFSDSSPFFPNDYYQLIHDFLANPERSGEYTLDGTRYARAALAIFSHYVMLRSSIAVSHDSVLLHVLSFLLPRASRSEELITQCRQARLQVLPTDSPFEPTYITAGRQAIQSYLQKMGAISLLPEVYTLRKFIVSYNSYT